MRVGGTSARVHLHEATLGDARARGLETELARLRPAADGDEDAVERLRLAVAEPRLDPTAGVPQRAHARAEADRLEHALAASGQVLHEIAVGAGQQPVEHLHHRHLAPERRVDLPELEADVAAADDEEAAGDVRDLEGRRGVHHALAHDLDARQPGRRRAGGEDRVLEADLLRLVAGDAQAARVFEGGPAADHLDVLAAGDAGQAAGQLADHALALPLAQRIERDPRLAEVHAELPGALGLAQHRGDVQERLGRDAALEEAGAPQTLVEIDDDRLQAQLGAAKRRRVAARPAADDGHVDLAHEIAHHHAVTGARSAAARTSVMGAIAAGRLRGPAAASRAARGGG